MTAPNQDEIWVFVADPIRIDLRIFNSWVNGVKAQKVAQQLRKNKKAIQFDSELVVRDVLDQYRNFLMLEHYLMHPKSLSQQVLFNIEPSIQQEILNQYYTIDGDLIKEFIGKKLRVKLRKELDEIGDRLQIKFKSCRRQFDNLRRIRKRVMASLKNNSQSASTNTASTQPNNTNTSTRGVIDTSIVEFIQHHFLIPRDLACTYARALFLVHHRFETRKRVSALRYSDLEALASALMTRWTVAVSSSDNLRGTAVMLGEAQSVYLDTRMISVLRELKNQITEQLSEFKHAVKDKLSARLESRKMSALMHKLGNVIKELFSIGYNLSHAKHFKDIFVDLADKIAEPCLRAELSASDVEVLLNVIEDELPLYYDRLGLAGYNKSTALSYWIRYIEAIKECLLIMYNRLG
jgi:hypothetical protein